MKEKPEDSLELYCLGDGVYATPVEEGMKYLYEYMNNKHTKAIKHAKMRLAQIASGDYKVCGHFAEDVAKDALLTLHEAGL